MGILATPLNSDILTEAQNNDTTDVVWAQVYQSQIILLSPELLQSDTIRTHLGLDQPESQFQKRCTVLVCDEAHLVYIWGQQFREPYRDIGRMRNRLQRRVRLLLLTATLRAGDPLRFVQSCFDLRDGDYFDLHRSNLRPEIRVTTSILESSLKTAVDFPEFRWIVGLPGITIIFAPDRSSALRITLYLRRCNRFLAKRVRKYDAMNDRGTYDKETLEMISSLDSARDLGLIIVATSILMVGFDVNGVRRVFVLEPVDFDEEIQKKGRLLRNKASEEEIAECYVYVSWKTMQDALALVNETEHGAGNNTAQRRKEDPQHGKQAHRPSLDISMAHRLVAKCRTEEQNRQYNNPPYGQPPCTCQMCTRYPLRVDPPCLCSGCQPGMSERDVLTTAQNILRSISADAAEAALAMGFGVPRESEEKPHEVMTRDGQQLVRRYLTELDDKLFEDGIGNPGGLYTPGMFVPTPVIDIVIDHFFDLDSPLKLSTLLADFQLPDEWLQGVWDTMYHKIIPAFRDLHVRKKDDAWEAQVMKELGRLSEEKIEELKEHTPILDDAAVNPTMLVKGDLIQELQWHCLWDREMPKGWKGLKKHELTVLLQHVITRFHDGNYTVEGVRAVLQRYCN